MWFVFFFLIYKLGRQIRHGIIVKIKWDNAWKEYIAVTCWVFTIITTIDSEQIFKHLPYQQINA